MRALYRHALVALLLAFTLSACQTMPAIDTPGKRFAVFEIAYQETIKTATLYQNEGRLTPDRAKAIDQIFDQTTGLREAALQAWINNDMPEFDNRMQALNVVLQSVRALLAEAESHGR